MSNATVVLTDTPGRRLRRALRQLVRRPSILLAALIVLTAILAALFPAMFTSRDPLGTDPQHILQPPGTAGFLLGSDAVGRDLLTRIIYGAGPSLQAALIALVVSFVGGVVLGLLAGYFGRWVDVVIMRVVDVVLAFPALLFAMAIIAVLGIGPVNVALAVGIVGVAQMARVMRAEVMRVRTQTYVEAAGVSGARWYSLLLRHVLPNSLGPIVVLATLEFGIAILAVSSLSFLGFGAPPPAPEWGSLVADGRQFIVAAWWLAIFPGLAIALTVLSTNRIARAFEGELKG
ncbi:MAG: peptide ABC transporter permease [Micrococcales bacterium 73-13]|nr:MAG: peptide ABC transporter permease [Micrococcales bacterium 73-13]